MASRSPAPVLVAGSGRPLQQGDLFVTSGVARVVPASAPSENPSIAATGPSGTAPFETHRSALDEPLPPSGMPALDVVGGRVLVMVVSHDCQLDKELHHAARRLQKEGLSEVAAYAQAESDDTLDRNVTVSPVVELTELPLAGDPNFDTNVRAGRVVGYLPVPARAGLLPAEAVVDLGYRTTADRATLTQRLASLTDPARLQLRYALARMDSLRTPDLGAELEAAVGQRITSVDPPNSRR